MSTQAPTVCVSTRLAPPSRPWHRLPADGSSLRLQARLRKTIPLLLTLSLLLIAGCLVGPNFQTPQVAMPAGWDGPATRPATRASVTTTQPAQPTTWWGHFNDPTLESLITRAIQSSLDLKQATSRVREARAARGVSASELLPTVDTAGSFRRSGHGNSSNSTAGTSSSGTRNLYSAGLDASWEIDVFGGVRRNIEAADATIVVAVEDRRDVLISLAAEVARNYIDLRGFQQQIVIAERNLQIQKKSLNLTQKQFDAGFASGLDIANAQAQVASTQAEIPLLEGAARQAIYSLSVLLAQPPGALVPELAPRSDIPRVPALVPIGLPSDLLQRRPDIRRAQADVHAATARIGAATADLFPRFSLVGSFGFSSNRAGSLFDWSSRTWSFGPSISWPLFDAGRIRANIAVQNERQEQALLAYRATILRGIQEVENALVAYAREQQHRESLIEAVAANRKAVELATQVFSEGEKDFLNVLLAQRALLAAEDAMVRSEHNIALNLVSLYKALGGGWDVEAKP